MKIKYIILIVLFSIYQLTNAQVTPIETISDSKKTSYNTNTHITNKSLVESQSYDLNLKLNRNVRINSKNGEATIVPKTAVRVDKNKIKEILESNETINQIPCN